MVSNSLIIIVQSACPDPPVSVEHPKAMRSHRDFKGRARIAHRVQAYPDRDKMFFLAQFLENA